MAYGFRMLCLCLLHLQNRIIPTIRNSLHERCDAGICVKHTA